MCYNLDGEPLKEMALQLINRSAISVTCCFSITFGNSQIPGTPESVHRTLAVADHSSLLDAVIQARPIRSSFVPQARMHVIPQWLQSTASIIELESPALPCIWLRQSVICVGRAFSK
jgi:hypothetical protein